MHVVHDGHKVVALGKSSAAVLGKENINWPIDTLTKIICKFLLKHQTYCLACSTVLCVYSVIFGIKRRGLFECKDGIVGGTTENGYYKAAAQ